MAFGIKRTELIAWKQAVQRGEIAYLTHYWYDARFPNYKTVTKVGCADFNKLKSWCMAHGLDPKYIHAHERFPHFDLMGAKQVELLKLAGQWEQIERFKLDG